jgi:hypothetical protein
MTETKQQDERHLLYTLLALCKKLRVDENEINEAKDYLILILIFWIPFTIGVIGHLWGLIAWDIFGNTDYVTEYYTSRFNSGIESYLWIINEIGVFATILCGVVALMYLWLCRKVWVAIFY